jgi:hypothetical protein
MQANDFPRFQAVMTGMAELYQRELSGPLMDAYWLALADWSLHEFEAGAGQLMKTEEFMPRPVAFNNLRKAGRVTAAETWTEVLEHARHDSPNFMNGHVNGLSELANRALRAIGGLHTVAMSDPTKTTFLERRFTEVYNQLSEADETREALPGFSFDRPALSGPVSVGSLLGRINGNSGQS